MGFIVEDDGAGCNGRARRAQRAAPAAPPSAGPDSMAAWISRTMASWSAFMRAPLRRSGSLKSNAKDHRRSPWRT